MSAKIEKTIFLPTDFLVDFQHECKLKLWYCLRILFRAKFVYFSDINYYLLYFMPFPSPLLITAIVILINKTMRWYEMMRLRHSTHYRRTTLLCFVETELQINKQDRDREIISNDSFYASIKRRTTTEKMNKLFTCESS